MIEPEAQPIAPGDANTNGDPDQGNGGAQQDDLQAIQDDHALAEGAEGAAAQMDAESEEEAGTVDEEIDEVAEHAIGGMEDGMEGEGGPRAKTRRGGDGSRGRSASRAKKDTPAPAPRHSMRSASRSRPPTSTAAAPALSTRRDEKQTQSSKAKGKRKATSEDGTSDGKWSFSEVPSPDIGSDATAGTSKGNEVARGAAGHPVPARGTWTLKDITPVEIPVKDVPHV